MAVHLNSFQNKIHRLTQDPPAAADLIELKIHGIFCYDFTTSFSSFTIEYKYNNNTGV